MSHLRKPRTAEQLWCDCVHEAGHAVIARHLGLQIVQTTTTSVTVRAPAPRPIREYVRVRGGAYRARNLWEAPSVRRELTTAAAGEMAARWILDVEYGGGGRDYMDCVELLRGLGADAKVIDREIVAAQRRALKLIWKLKPEILATAERLRADTKLPKRRKKQ